MSPLRKLAFSLVVSGALLGLVEGGLRAALPSNTLLYSWEREDGMLVPAGQVPAGQVPTGLAPSAGPLLLPKPGSWGGRHDGRYAWEAIVNADTLREDGPVAPVAAPGERRLLALGDSWTFGISVTQGRTIPDQIEDRLEAAGWAPKVDVINAGVPSFSAFDVLWRWNTLGDRYAVDGVIIGEPHNTANGQSRAADRAAWFQAMRVSEPSEWRVYRLLRRGFDRFRRPRYATPPTGVAADTAAGDLELLVRDIRARGLPVYFLLLPVHMDRALSEPAVEGPLGARMRAAGAIVGGHGLGERACWGFVDHGHPSEAGAGALATVAAELVTGGVSLPGMAQAPACRAP